MSIFDEYLYIDYENVQNVQVNIIKKTTKVKIIVGENQKKVPVELVQKTQPLGNIFEWIQVNRKGQNALDFFIVFFLAKDIAADKKKKFIIYSKDTGYDPLIEHLKQSGIKVKRIVSFQELYQNKVIKIDEARIKKVKENLMKVAENSRPKNKSSLTGFITDRLKGTSKQDIDKIIEDLFITKVVSEENGLIKYSLDN